MKRYRPDELLAQYREIRGDTTTEEFFRAPRHKKTQEMWCAAHFALGYQKGVGECYVWISDEDEQTDVDFYLEINGTKHPFQITELMEPKRKRGDEYKNGGGESGTTHLEDWSFGTEHGPAWIRGAIEKKRGENYAGAAHLNLLVYVNFHAYQQQYDLIAQECSVASQGFGSVWLLNGNTLCCIHGGDEFMETGGWLQLNESLADGDL
jgi:hypothetical protein